MDAAAVLKEYADLTPLQTRIATHERYSERRTDPVRDVMDELRLPSEAALLDVGCGTGTFLRTLSTAGHRGKLIGLDTSAAAVHQASIIEGVRAVRGSASALPFETNSVDLCTARHMLYHVPDPLTALSEFRRVTRPGGQVVVVVNDRRTSARTMDWVRSVASRFGADVSDSRLNDVNSATLPSLMECAYGSVRPLSRKNALVFDGPTPLIAFAVSNLSFCGVGADFARRQEVVEALSAEAQAWFRTNPVWRDPKGYLVCTSSVT